MYFIDVDLGTSAMKLLVVDKTGAVICPAILWNDGRTAEETAQATFRAAPRARSLFLPIHSASIL